MLTLRLLFAWLLAVALFAQQAELPDQIFRTTVNIIPVPVTVTGRDGDYVTGLQPSDFRLFDNGKPQDIKVDVSFIPISLVVVIQTSWNTESVLPKVKQIAPLLQGVVTGDQGEVAILAFDHRIQRLQDFTTDADLISKAFASLKTGSTSSRLIDAVTEGIRMLARRPTSRRRVILQISETVDRSSEGRVRDALTLAQLNNVTIETVNINRLVTTLTAKAQPPRPDPIPPTARTLPANVPPTPDAARQLGTSSANSANFVPVFVEIFKQVKGIFIPNPAEVFTKYTGGREYSFISQKDLERAIQNVGQELHNQYLLSYNPNNKMEAGFHEISVQVVDKLSRPRRDVKILTRPGYWMAAVPE
jgi:VWFA-related protein